jgi:hypothetical protein
MASCDGTRHGWQVSYGDELCDALAASEAEARSRPSGVQRAPMRAGSSSMSAGTVPAAGSTESRGCRDSCSLLCSLHR